MCPTGQYEQLIAKGYPEWLAKLIYEAGKRCSSTASPSGPQRK